MLQTHVVGLPRVPKIANNFLFGVNEWLLVHRQFIYLEIIAVIFSVCLFDGPFGDFGILSVLIPLK